MNAYLTKLGIRTVVQEWLAPHCYVDEAGNLCFSYGNEAEVYGLGFHRVPLNGRWTAGPEYGHRVIISSSVIETIAWLNFNYASIGMIDQVLFVAGNYNLVPRGKKYCFLFGNDLLGHACDLKAAAWLAGHPAEISMAGDRANITFRNKHFVIPAEKFSLHTFEQMAGFRFNVNTLKPNRHNTWLDQLLND